jgi:multidrug efflux pump subunit AcrB
MKVNVSAWCIRNPIPSMLLFIMLTLVGLMSFRAMKIQQFPDIDLPTVIVTANLPGASPGQLETEVARKIENSISTLQGLKHIYTTVQDGTATVTAEFRLEKNTQQAVDDVRDAVARVRSDLPGDLRDPVINKMELAGSPILTYTVASTRMDDEALSWFVDNQVTKALLSVKGVGAGVARGRREPRGACRAGSAAPAGAQHHRRRHLAAAPADPARGRGRPHRRGRRGAVGAHHRHGAVGRRAGGDGDRPARRAPHPPGPGGRRHRHVAEPRQAALLNGKPVVGFEIVRSRGAGEVDVAAGVRAELEKLRAQHPDIQVVEAFNFVDPVIENYEGSMALLYEGAILAGHRGVVLPAQLARHAGVGHGAAAVGDPRRSARWR